MNDTLSSSTPSPALRRRVLRALFALSENGGRPSLEALLAIVPAVPHEIHGALAQLDADGFVDGKKLRLTMVGLVAAKTPSPIAYERRSRLRLAKVVRVA